jgi:hypothetical protein
MAAGTNYIEYYEPEARLNGGVATALPVNFSGTTIDASGNMSVAGTQTVTGAATFIGTVTATGAIANNGGETVVTAPAPTAFSTGGLPVNATTGLTQKQIVTTETYFAEVFIPENTTITGISILNGHTTSASQNMFVGLADATGLVVAKSNTTTAQAAADAYQQIPFTSTYAALGPSKYFVLVQGSATTGFIATSVLGNYGASKITSETYGSFLTSATYKTTTFTTGLGPIASTY